MLMDPLQELWVTSAAVSSPATIEVLACVALPASVHLFKTKILVITVKR